MAFGVRKGHRSVQPTQDDITNKPSLGCEHVVGVKLIFHAKEKQIRAYLAHAGIVKVLDPKLSGLALKSNLFVKERESVLVACAQDNRVHVFDLRVVAKNNSLATCTFLHERLLFNALWPAEASRLPLAPRLGHSFAMCHNYALGTVLVKERNNVFR